MKHFVFMLLLATVCVGPAYAEGVKVGTFKRVGSDGPICLDSHSPPLIFVAPSQGVIPSLKQNTPWLNSTDMHILETKDDKPNSVTYIAQLGMQKQSHVIKVSNLEPESFSVSFFSTRTDGYGKEVADLNSRKELCTIDYEFAPELNHQFKAAQMLNVRAKQDAPVDLPILLLSEDCITDGRRLKLSKDINVTIADQVHAHGDGVRAIQEGTVDDTIVVKNVGGMCSVHLRMDRFKFLAANAAVYSSGWAQASADRDLCLALHQKLSGKLTGPTPKLLVSLNDSKQSFANYVGGQSTIHDLQILQVCEVQ